MRVGQYHAAEVLAGAGVEVEVLVGAEVVVGLRLKKWRGILLFFITM